MEAVSDAQNVRHSSIEVLEARKPRPESGAG